MLSLTTDIKDKDQVLLTSIYTTLPQIAAIISLKCNQRLINISLCYRRSFHYKEES